ncbi:MAG: cytochrome c family protein [Sphingomicrobium sp.]
MNDRFSTISGWVLFAGIVTLGSSIVSGLYFHGGRPEKMGYPIEGVVVEGEGGAAAEKPIDFSVADAALGEQVFKKCAACHNADKGGANQLGPNLWAVLGEPIGKGANGFAFSEALSGKGGSWNFANLSEWLANPKKFAPGTKMTFAGLSKPEDRANVIAFLNAHSDAPQPLPAAPPAAAPDASASKPGTGPATGPQKAEKEPVLTEQQTGANPKNVGGEGAAKLTGPSDVRKPN